MIPFAPLTFRDLIKGCAPTILAKMLNFRKNLKLDFDNFSDEYEKNV